MNVSLIIFCFIFFSFLFSGFNFVVDLGYGIEDSCGGVEDKG